MKTLIKYVFYIIIALLLLVIVAWFSPFKYLVNGAYATYLHGHTSASIDDAQFFQTEIIANDKPSEIYSETIDSFAPSDSVNQLLELSGSGALLVIYKDTIRHEQYWNGLSDSSQTNSFSMAKSIVTILTQIAIQKGIIPHWDVPVVQYLPELKGPHAKELTLRHLSTMTAGLDWNEHYTNAFGITAQAYYGPDLHQLMLDKVPTKDQPGQQFHYQSGATAFLGMCLERAAGQSIASLASEWLWKPLGAEQNATWHVDEEGHSLYYCCVNSNARDFSRIGLMLLHQGKYNQKEIVDSTFIYNASRPIRSPEYGQSFWLDDDGDQNFYYLRGLLGQFVIIVPDYDLVICRLGSMQGPSSKNGSTPKITRDLASEYSQIVSKYLKTN